MGITGFHSFLVKWANHAPNIGYSKAQGQFQLKPVSSAPLFWGLSPNSITLHAAWGSFYLPLLLWPHPHPEPLVMHLHLPDKPFPWLTPLQSVRQSFNTACLWGFAHALCLPFRTVINGPAHLSPDYETGWLRLCSVHLLSLMLAKCLAYSERSENIS